MAAILFAAKALVGTLPALALEARPTVTLKELIDDFCTQMPTAPQLMDNVMQSGAASFVIHCKSATNAEAVLHSGLCFRGHPISFKPAPNTQWMKLTRVVYGTSENAIKTRLSQHGSVLKIKRDTMQGIGTSCFSVRMELKSPIPSRITINHYPVNVFYRGQQQQCLQCDQVGHVSKQCPYKKSTTVPPPAIVGPTSVDPPSVDLPSIDPPVDGDGMDITPPVADPVLQSVSAVSSASTSSSVSSSTMSVSTPRNVDSGKRQGKPESTELPAKQPKPSFSYMEYERERVFLWVLKNPTEAQQAFSSATAALSADQLTLFERTFAYRHPLMLPEGDELRIWALKVLASEVPPDDVLDLSSGRLSQPPLPPDAVGVSSVMSYSSFEHLYAWKYLAAAKQISAFPPAVKVALVSQISKAVFAGYMNFFLWVHPEYMPFCKSVDMDRIKLLYDVVKAREPLSYS